MIQNAHARVRNVLDKVPSTPKGLLVTVLLLAAGYYTCSILSEYTGPESNPALIYVLAVTLISLLTDGYFYGIIASIIGTFLINYYFMYPYSAFSLSFEGYPVAMVAMVAISCVVCALTSRVKLQAQEAVKREQKAKALFELTEELNREKAAIQLEKDRETIRSNILRAVSHDLRTPLTSISGAASVLLSSEELRSEKDMSLLKDIRDDANDLITMVENLLSITRIQEGSNVLNKQDELLEEVAGDAVIKFRRRFPDCKVKLLLSDDLMLIPMDPILIKQVILNLLENSVRHSGDRENIRVHLFSQDGWAVVEVRDSGRGVAPEVRMAIQAGRVPPRAVSGDTSRGMGIGLSVCQSIIKAHGGFFVAGNDPAGGAVFRFGIPIMEAESNG